jgi:hypothetical protein
MDALIALFDDYFVNYSVFGNKLILIANDMSCVSLFVSRDSIKTVMK